MAITINSAALTHAQTSPPGRWVKLNVDLDNSYPTGGYDISGQLEHGTVRYCESVFAYDGSALNLLKIDENGMLVAYAVTNGAQGAERTAATDLSGITGIEINCWVD